MSDFIGRTGTRRAAAEMIGTVQGPPRITADVTVLLAGHTPAHGRALRATLEAGRMRVCGVATDLASTIDATRRKLPDLCLLDSELAGAGYADVGPILDAGPGVRVVILDGYASDAELLDAVAVGAAGHLPRDLHPAALTAALYDAVAGRPAFPRRVETVLAARLHARR
jgi:DNA-binding NarL/FixJ family response regulator